ncbi:glycosyltransferase family 2 protein [Aquimarina sp. W85]|uniref:glycosyltransferase family 2 protein n=1 Tax=Aquimarina rhodophyticola TaxID=3342246 RepID=UPI003672C31B
MRRKGISLIIIFKGRHKHLYNTLCGVKRGNLTPDEIILVEIGEAKSSIAEDTIEIQHLLLHNFEPDNLPIASARNVGAHAAQYDTLVFLDVDCIPSQNFLSTIHQLDIKDETIYMGNPRYLTRKIDEIEEKVLKSYSVSHPHRPSQDVLKRSNDYGMFWSLTFFLKYSTFLMIGGFDEVYKGYGAEDTDFAFKARALGIPFYLTPCTVYHQQHSFYRPPLNHLESIVNNCNHFYSKWSHWPMDNYLQEFANKDLILWNASQQFPIQLKSHPAQESIELAKVHDAPYA